MIARFVLAAVLGAACLCVAPGCSPYGDSREEVAHFGYTGSRPSECASCEE